VATATSREIIFSKDPLLFVEERGQSSDPVDLPYDTTNFVAQRSWARM